MGCTIVDLVVNYPGMLLAVAGTLTLVAVTLTSIRAARRRLRYEIRVLGKGQVCLQR